MTRRPVLFLSHSGADTETARDLKRRLLASPDAQASGLEVWFDKDDLLPGQSWQEQLEGAIVTRSTAFAVVVGTKGVVNWVDREVRLALSRATEGGDYPFVPVLMTPDVSKLPPFARQYQGVHLHSGDDAELAKLLQAVLGTSPDQEGAAGWRRPIRLTGSPFVGLRAMTEADSDRFFGREAEVEALVETVKAHRLVAIVADSGSGKSSLAQAGLIPRIRGGALEDRSREEPDARVWQVVVMRPGADPVENLRQGITAAAERLGLDGESRAALRRRIDPANRDEWVYALQCDLPVRTTETVLIVDQFEELLTQTPAGKRKPFIDWLMAITAPSAANAVRVVLTIRSDYFNLCSPYAAFYARIKPDAPTPDAGPEAGIRRSAHVRLKALTVAFERTGSVPETSPTSSPNSYSGLAAIVHRPLILAGHTDAAEREALLSAIRRDVSDRPGDLALVQVALYETWRESHAGRDNLIEAFSRIGGVAGALANAAENVRTEKLNDRERAVLEAVLVRLVTLGDTGGATRRLARRDEFDAERTALAEKLTTDDCGRLLLAGTDSSEISSFEICHEQLITQWPWWQNCLSAAAGDMRRLTRLMLKSAEWSGGGKAPRFLATGAELDLFSGVAERRRSWLSKGEVAFVSASTLWASVWRGAGIAAVVALVLTTLAMIVVNNSANIARKKADEAAGEALKATAGADRARDEALLAKGDADRARDEALRAEGNAEKARDEAVKVLATSDFQRGTTLLQSDETTSEGMALLARAVRRGQDERALTRLWTLLQQRDFWLPVTNQPEGSVPVKNTSRAIPDSIKARFGKFRINGTIVQTSFISVSGDQKTVFTVIGGGFNDDVRYRVWRVNGTPITPWLKPSYSGDFYAYSANGYLSFDGKYLALEVQGWRETAFLQIFELSGGRIKRLGNDLAASGGDPHRQLIGFSHVEWVKSKLKQVPADAAIARPGYLLLTSSPKGNAVIFGVFENDVAELTRNEHATPVVFAAVDDKQEWLMSASDDGIVHVSSIDASSPVGNHLALENRPVSIERNGANNDLTLTFENGKRAAFSIHLAAKMSSSTESRLSKKVQCKSWVEKDKSDPPPPPLNSPLGEVNRVATRQISIARQARQTVTSPIFAADIMLACLSTAEDRIAITTSDFVTEVWALDFSKRFGLPIVERRLFGAKSVPENTVQTIPSPDGKHITIASYFWNPPNEAYYWVSYWDLDSGLPLMDRALFYYDDGPTELAVLTDAVGRYLAFLINERDAVPMQWLQVSPPMGANAWIADYAEAIAGITVDDSGALRPVPDRLEKLKGGNDAMAAFAAGSKAQR